MSHTVNENLEMMQTPMRWPAFPFLPLVRRRDPDVGQLGLLVCANGRVKPVVYLANLLEGIDADTPTIGFPDFEGIVDAGWEVD